MTEARCPVHPDRPAARTCARCGRFLCAECAGDGAHCRDCVRQLIAGMASSRGRAELAVVFLWFNVAMDAVSGLIAVWGATAPAPNVARSVIEGLMGLGILAAFIGGAVTFLRWEHLAVRQLTALGLFSAATPGAAVGAWFIPFLNLVKPVQTLRSMFGAAGGSADADARLTPWWAMWIVSNVLAQVETRMAMANGLEADPPPASYVVGIFSNLTGAIAAVLCIGVVRALQKHLDAKLTG